MNPGKLFVQEFVVSVGFFTGLWIAVGVNPTTEINNALMEVIKAFNPESDLIFWLKIFPTLALIASIIGALIVGGKLGLVAVFCGFLGGITFVSFPLMGLFLTAIGVVIGFIAPSMNEDY